MKHHIILFRGMLSLRFYITQNNNGDGFFLLELLKACQAFLCYLLDCQWKVNASIYLWALKVKAFIVYWFCRATRDVQHPYFTNNVLATVYKVHMIRYLYWHPFRQKWRDATQNDVTYHSEILFALLGHLMSSTFILWYIRANDISELRNGKIYYTKILS